MAVVLWLFTLYMNRWVFNDSGWLRKGSTDPRPIQVQGREKSRGLAGLRYYKPVILHSIIESPANGTYQKPS